MLDRGRCGDKWLTSGVGIGKCLCFLRLFMRISYHCGGDSVVVSVYATSGKVKLRHIYPP
jgi:hypothetical protein